MRGSNPSPIDAATRAARSALRPVDRTDLISVGSRYVYDAPTQRTEVLTLVTTRTELATIAAAEALGMYSPEVIGPHHVLIRSAA